MVQEVILRSILENISSCETIVRADGYKLIFWFKAQEQEFNNDVHMVQEVIMRSILENISSCETIVRADGY